MKKQLANIRVIRGQILFLSLFVTASHAQWIKQNVDTTASLRGLAVVNEKIVWASGTGGTVIRTVDGGKTWKVMTVPGAEKLDFRDIEAFDRDTAYILSIGNGENSRIYKTVDGGEKWNEQFRNKQEKAFFDAIACWDRNNCIAVSDPVDNKFVLAYTKNRGLDWNPIDTFKMPDAKDGEAAFAASGTCLITQGRNNAFLVTGGSDSRVFRSIDRGRTWKVYGTPIIKGTSGSGIFSIAMKNETTGMIVGGNYEKPAEDLATYATTVDGGRSWKIGNRRVAYRSGAAFVENTVVVVGTNGSDSTQDLGAAWRHLGAEDLNSVQAKGRRAVWAVGPKGLVVKIK